MKIPPDRVGLVTGATGYVGGHVVERLLADGWRVRVLVRDADRLPAWSEDVEVVEGDAGDRADVERALAGADVAWYLIHSMGAGPDFEERDHELALVFAEAAREARIGRIVYLGGLHPDERPLSDHLASRLEVGRILLASGVPTAAVQAGVVLGQGSVSFDMLRTLSERLPGAFGPQWLRNQIQPIHVDDVVHYLVRCADLPADISRAFDVGGPDVVSYAEMMQRYAAALRLGPRLVAAVPVMTPRLAAQWIALVTPIDGAMATPLVESLVHDTVVKEEDLAELVGRPDGGEKGFEEAVRTAAQGLDQHRWAKVLGVCLAAAGLATAAELARNTTTAHGRSRLTTAARAALRVDAAVLTALHVTDALDEGDRLGAAGAAALLWVALGLDAAAAPRGTGGPVAAVAATAVAGLGAALGRRRVQRGVLFSPVVVAAVGRALARLVRA